MSVAVLLVGCAPKHAEEQLYSLTVVENGFDITITELERGPSYSVLAFKQVESPTVTASGVVMGRAAVDIATARRFEYFTGMAGPAQTRPDGTRIMKIFFTNDNAMSLKDLMGEEYSEEAQRIFDRFGYMSVSQFHVLFGGPAPNSVSVSPQWQRELNRRGRDAVTSGSQRRAAYYAAMKSDLGNLASREESYLSDHGTYTDNAASLEFVPVQGVTVTITASMDGWAATATHVALPSTDGCAVYYGTATAPTSPIQPPRPGEIACNDHEP